MRMPRYHLHMETGGGPAGDVTGRELGDDNEALREAKVAAARVLADEVGIDPNARRVIVTLERDGGEQVAVVTARLDVEKRV